MQIFIVNIYPLAKSVYYGSKTTAYEILQPAFIQSILKSFNYNEEVGVLPTTQYKAIHLYEEMHLCSYRSLRVFIDLRWLFLCWYW